MDQISLFSQLYTLAEPLFVPFLSIGGAICSIVMFWKKNVSSPINEIKLSSALIANDVKHIKDDVEKMRKEEREGRQEDRKELMEFFNLKFSQYDQNFSLIFNKL